MVRFSSRHAGIVGTFFLMQARTRASVIIALYTYRLPRPSYRDMMDNGLLCARGGPAQREQLSKISASEQIKRPLRDRFCCLYTYWLAGIWGIIVMHRVRQGFIILIRKYGEARARMMRYHQGTRETVVTLQFFPYFYMRIRARAVRGINTQVVLYYVKYFVIAAENYCSEVYAPSPPRPRASGRRNFIQTTPHRV